MKFMKFKNIRVYIYAMLFLLIMIIDQRLHTGSIVVSRTFVQALPLPFLIIMLMQIKKEKIKDIWYLLYLVIASVITIILSIWLFFNVEFYLKYSLLVIEVLLYGFLLLYGLLNKNEIFIIKKFMNWKAIFWSVILFLMCISRYDGYWTYFLFALFLPLVLLDIRREEQERLLQGMIYGIISSYFIIQGMAFVFRPYETLRYLGLYNNTNMNALFYVIVFSAFLANQFRFSENNARKMYKVLNYIFTMSVFGFTILTMGKAAFLTEIVLMVIYLLIMCRRNKRKVKFILTQIVLWVSASIILLPICFMAARYIPPLFHHPVWFYGEYLESKVHSFDTYDSEKYPEVRELADVLLERYLGIEHVFTEELIVEEKKEEINESNAIAGDGLDALHPLYINGEASDSYTARIGIWKEYINRINIFGHKIEEQHFWLTENYYISHAHNVFLEFNYNFGVIVGILFSIGYGICAIKQFIQAYKTNSYKNFTIFIMLIVLGLFGMFELDWYVGQAPLTFFFFMICFMIWNENMEKKLLFEGEKKNESNHS